MKTVSLLKVGVALLIFSLFASCSKDDQETLEVTNDVSTIEFYENNESFLADSYSGKSSGGCITCALELILKEEWRTPNYGGPSGGTTGWTFNVRNRFGRKINAEEIKKLEQAANKKGVKSVDKQAIIYGNDGALQYKVVPHLVTLKNGEPYFVYQRYIVGFH